MAKRTIKLPTGEWIFDDRKPLGKPGGFGEVFKGHGSHGEVAVKRLKLTATQAAHRELKVGRFLMQRALKNVVPVFDVGQDSESDRYFIVMPLCDMSLQDVIDESSYEFDIKFCASALLSILTGLKEASDVTHRDLKPSNILRHDGSWKIADFGIAKFVEDSTSLETLRTSLTPAYAAPEQWAGERPTGATDIYAVGCIAHALATRRPPFHGSVEEVRNAHLNSAPIVLAEYPPQVSQFISQMLRKVPMARPTLDRCLRIFGNMPLETKSVSPIRQTLAAAALQIAEREAAAEAARQLAENRRREREALYRDASKELDRLRGVLFGDIRSVSENAHVDGTEIRFGDCILNFGKSAQAPDVAARNHPEPSYDLIAWSRIAITCFSSSHRYEWSASLFYGAQRNGNGYRWYEAAFWNLGSSGRNEPFALNGHDPNFNFAIGPGLHSTQLAYGPVPIDAEHEDTFLDRWLGLVAKAARGGLQRPNQMPISSSFWASLS